MNDLGDLCVGTTLIIFSILPLLNLMLVLILLNFKSAAFYFGDEDGKKSSM